MSEVARTGHYGTQRATGTRRGGYRFGLFCRRRSDIKKGHRSPGQALFIQE